MKNIPYGRQHIDQDDIDAVTKILKSDFLTQGPEVKKFENLFSHYVGSKYSVAVNNATSGLHLAVLALGLKKGDRVITSPITFAASANCVRYVGGEVWFADIDKDSYLISLESTRKLLKSKPKGFFKGIIVVDFAGLPIDVESFRKLANEYDLWIVEDACHAPGGYFTDSKGILQKCGNGNYADIAVFSFHPVKHIACGEGGMITTNSKKIFEKLNSLRTHGITKNNLIENHGGWFYEMRELGYNYRLTDIQSALGISQLKKNDNGVKRRNEIAKKYIESFKSKIKYQILEDGKLNAYHLFIIEVENRKELYDYLRRNNVFTQIHYIPIHTLPYYNNIGYDGAELFNSEKYYSRCISLPMYPSLSDKEQSYVINKINHFYGLNK